MDLHFTLPQSVNESAEKVSGLTAERIGEDKDAFFIQNKRPIVT